MFPIRDDLPRRAFPVATTVIILVNALVFLCELMLPEQALEQSFYLFGVVPAHLYPQPVRRQPGGGRSRPAARCRRSTAGRGG